MSWSDYVKAVHKNDHHNVKGRADVLAAARQHFAENLSFASIPLEVRKGIAGFINSEKIEWKWFGSMQGAGYFKEKINDNDAGISAAIDTIPVSGEVKKEDYDEYVEQFKKAFMKNGEEIGHGVATASRLLAMKRPDYFVCFNSANAKGLRQDFGLKPFGTHGYERYWTEIIERILELHLVEFTETTE